MYCNTVFSILLKLIIELNCVCELQTVTVVIVFEEELHNRGGSLFETAEGSLRLLGHEEFQINYCSGK